MNNYNCLDTYQLIKQFDKKREEDYKELKKEIEEKVKIEEIRKKIKDF